MKNMNSRSLCLVLLFAISSLTLANEAAMYAKGGTIRPMKEHTSITMEKEIVNADIHPNVAYVKCVFTLYNTSSKPKTVQWGSLRKQMTAVAFLNLLSSKLGSMENW